MKTPFTLEEQKISNSIVAAHNEFVKLEATHPNDITDWVNAIHTLQGILGKRVLRRDYPETFSTIKNKP